MRQPTLPPEGSYGQIESRFIELSPADLWPEAQNTNFGQFRKVVTDILQDKANELTSLWFEMFPDTANKYLGLWESEYDLPVAPTGKTLAERRAYLLARVRHGPFTRKRLRDTIAAFVTATFGDSIALTPIGVPMDVGGVPLYSGLLDLIGAFRVYENFRNFTYEVWLKSAITPDIARMTRELNRITPAGIQFTIDNTHVDILDYFRIVRNAQPVWYSRLGADASDSSGYANNGTLNGAPAALASPGLLHANVAGGNGGLVFDGVDDFITVPIQAQLQVADNFTIEVIFKTAAVVNEYLFSTQSGSWNVRVRPAPNGTLALDVGGSGTIVESTIPVNDNVTHHAVIRKSGTTISMRIDGVDRTKLPVVPTSLAVPTALYIGQKYDATARFTGSMDEPAIYNYLLPDKVSDDHNNTRQDIATY